MLCLFTLCFFSHISGVKRGVCSQINHFPEDADFDHDGAEYVLRKSIPALLGMNDEWEREACFWIREKRPEVKKEESVKLPPITF